MCSSDLQPVIANFKVRLDGEGHPDLRTVDTPGVGNRQYADHRQRLVEMKSRSFTGTLTLRSAASFATDFQVDMARYHPRRRAGLKLFLLTTISH